jgi:hypothetical protein
MTASKREPSDKGGKVKGRPSSYTKQVGDEICLRLADGESLRKICESEDMPSKTSVFRWLADEKNKAFRDQYALARELQADSLFDEMLDIADESVGDSYEDSNGNERINHEVVQRSKLRIDTRKWLAGKLRPKVYGDKADAPAADKSVAEELKALADKLPD